MSILVFRPKNRTLHVGQSYTITGAVTTVETTIRDEHGVLVYSSQRSFEDTPIALVVAEATRVIAEYMAPVI